MFRHSCRAYHTDDAFTRWRSIQLHECKEALWSLLQSDTVHMYLQFFIKIQVIKTFYLVNIPAPFVLRTQAANKNAKWNEKANGPWPLACYVCLVRSQDHPLGKCTAPRMGMVQAVRYVHTRKINENFHSAATSGLTAMKRKDHAVCLHSCASWTIVCWKKMHANQHLQNSHACSRHLLIRTQHQHVSKYSTQQTEWQLVYPCELKCS